MRASETVAVELAHAYAYVGDATILLTKHGPRLHMVSRVPLKVVSGERIILCSWIKAKSYLRYVYKTPCLKD